VTTTAPARKPLTRDERTRMRVENALSLREAEARGALVPTCDSLGRRYVASATYARARDLTFLGAEDTSLVLESPEEYRTRSLAVTK
jgi:hypothetical protein